VDVVADVLFRVVDDLVDVVGLQALYERSWSVYTVEPGAT